MLETSVRLLNGVAFEAESRGHKLISDQPPANGGADRGMTPPELMLASLATCAGYYALQYLKARNLPVEGLQVHVSAEKGTQPARLASFEIDVEAPGADDPKHREGLYRAVEKCLIHNTMLQAPAINIAVRPVRVTA